MSTLGLYSSGTSVLHRMSAGWKLVGLAVAMICVIASRTWWQFGVLAFAVAAGYAVARISPRTIWRQLRPLRWLLLIVGAVQVLLAGWPTALQVCGSLLLSLGIASLVTLTTRVTAILDVCQRMLRPLGRFGVDPDRVGLVLAMTIRCVPLLTAIVGDVSAARKARGLGGSMLALLVPVIVRALRSADAMGDALIARGVDD